MAKLTSITQVSHPRYNYLVTFKQGEERWKRYFKTKADARSFADAKEVELLNEGRKQAELTDAEKRAICRAREIADRLAAIGESFSLEMALDHFESHRSLMMTSVTLNTAFDEFMQTKGQERKRGEIGDRHLSDLRSRLTPFCKKHGKKLVAAIDSAEIEAWLNRLEVSAPTRINYKLRLQNLFKFCVSRGYAKTDPLANIKRPKLPSNPVAIFSVDEAQKLLNAACDGIRAALAIGAFTGLRAAEIAKLDWANVNLQSRMIEVRAATAKSKRRRLIEIPDNLVAWLAPLAQKAGPIALTPMKLRTRVKKAMQKAEIQSWPSNGLRHSFASYHYALHQDAAKTAAMLGHTDTNLLFQHYRELVRPDEAKRYFEIAPPSQPDNIILMCKTA